jgi:chitinase
LAFVNTQPDGSVIADTNFPTTLVTKWKSSGKKVVISVGGEHGNWQNVFASLSNTRNFISSLTGIVRKYNLDGVDLDIENYLTPPRAVANMILALRGALGAGKLIIVSPENVTVLQQCAVPNPDVASGWCNYFVPIIQLADSAINFYQPQAYNNWYEVAPGTLAYLQNVYLNWRNLQGLTSWAKPIPNFSGVAANKLLLGVLASPVAGGSSYYYPPSVIN